MRVYHVASVMHEPLVHGLVQAAVAQVIARLREHRHDYLVVGVVQTVKRGHVIKQLGGFCLVLGQHALVEAMHRRERGAVAQQCVEEFEERNVTPQHDKAHGQG